MYEMITLDHRQAVRKSMVVSFAVTEHRGLEAINVELSDGTNRLIIVPEVSDPYVKMGNLINEMNKANPAGSVYVSSHQQ